MINTFTTYIGRENEERIEFLYDAISVSAGVLTKAVIKFGTFCIDTEIDPELIYFENADNQVLCFKPGLIDGLSAGVYRDGKITIYDSSAVNGYAWAEFVIDVKQWSVCD